MKVTNAIQLDTNIYYFIDYNPFYRVEAAPSYTDKKIMDLKNYDEEDWKIRKQNEAENYFLVLLQENIKLGFSEEIAVCYIPRSEINCESHIGKIAKKLCASNSFVDATNCIKRIKNIDVAHLNTVNREGRQKDSIDIKNIRLLKNATILLLDDVISSGHTMNEIIDMLIDIGAARVIGIGMGKTT